jgi:hypothetical protein
MPVNQRQLLVAAKREVTCRGSWRGKEMTERVISQGDLDFYEKHKDVIENFLNQPGYSEERKTSIRNIPPMFEFEKMNYQEQFTRELDEYGNDISIYPLIFKRA